MVDLDEMEGSGFFFRNLYSGFCVVVGEGKGDKLCYLCCFGTFFRFRVFFI